MNTKIFLLIFIVNLIPFSVSMGISYQKPVQNTEYESDKLLSTPDSHNSIVILNATGHNNHYSEKAHGHSEDDGKSHNIHFNRFIKRRLKLVFCVLYKMIFIASYLSLLISFYSQYLV